MDHFCCGGSWYCAHTGTSCSGDSGFLVLLQSRSVFKRELTRSKRLQAVKYTMKAFGWFLCQLLFMKSVQVIALVMKALKCISLGVRV